MATLQIRNLPEELYDQLKASASVSRRSLNQEAIVLLEEGLRMTSPKLTKNSVLRRILAQTKKTDYCSEDAVNWIRNDRDSR